MYIQHNVILFVSIVTTLIIRTLNAGQHDGFPKQRRFLLDTANVTFCNFVCPIACPNGYVLTSTGCYLCQCSIPDSTSTVVTSPAQTVTSLGVFFTNPCNPAVRFCRRNCTNGFELGNNNCQYCRCINPDTTTVRPITTPSRVSTLVTTFRTMLTTISNTVTPPGLQTTLSQNKQDVNFNDPCITSQHTCDKNCSGDYVKGPGGCQYCLCGSRIPPEFKTTTPAVTAASTTIPHYLDLTPTSEACIIAKLICNQKCYLGFINHPDDCLFCSCQTSRSDSLNDASDVVYLTKPCLQGYSECGITCPNGYISGPRGCEFCSCK